MTLKKTDLPTNCHLISFDILDSTNEEAKKLASGGAKSGTVVWAREQVLGRGRYGRTWDSPYGNLYLSIIQRPTCFPSDATQLGFVTGVALAEALLSICNIEIALKWPNDIMANGKKASGILLESSINPNKSLEWLVIGVGLNIEKFPSDIENSTSLHKEGAEVTLENVLITFLHYFFNYVEKWFNNGFDPIRERWLSLSLKKGTDIKVRLPEDVIFGTFMGIDNRGSLLIEKNSEINKIDVGDIFPMVITN
ncbi:MAG: biotin--[acetyl-CoA-carboxylase] ligase [Alphaproteobacteria bacterium]